MPETALRDFTIDTQPILWAQAMLEAAEDARNDEVRDAILARVGLVLVTRFGIFVDHDGLRYSGPLPASRP